MAVSNMQALAHTPNSASTIDEADSMLTLPEHAQAEPQLHETPPQRLTRLFLQARELERTMPATAQAVQAEINLRSAMDEQTERFRAALAAGKDPCKFIDILQLLGANSEVPALLGAMRAVGNYRLAHARLLASACKDAQFDSRIAAVLDLASDQARHAPAGEQLDRLLGAVQRMRNEGDRYADWDAFEQR